MIVDHEKDEATIELGVFLTFLIKGRDLSEVDGGSTQHTSEDASLELETFTLCYDTTEVANFRLKKRRGKLHILVFCWLLILVIQNLHSIGENVDLRTDVSISLINLLQ